MWRTRRGTTDREVLSLVVHGPEYRNGELLVLNPDFFPEIKLLDLVEIGQPERTHPRLVLSVESLAPVRGKLQVSVAKDIAAQFGLEAFRSVTVRRVDPRDLSVDFVELSFKDQFLSRADIWRFKVTMLGQCVYVGRTVECLGIRSQVDAILTNNTQLHCGVIGDGTKIVVRSRSSRLFWLVQMSTEMWEFAPDGELYYEKLLHRLLRVLIAKWSESSVSHSVTIIAFSRSFYDSKQFPDGFDPKKAPFAEPRRQGFGPGCGALGSNTANGYGPTIHVDPVSGRYYEDFYKVVVMNFTGPDWNRLLLLLKKEFVSYYETHRWRTPEEVSVAEYEICHCSTMDRDDTRGEIQPSLSNVDYCRDKDLYVKWKTLPCGIPSRAKEGNILEAINVTLNVLDKHYMDRDLSRTGQGIVMLTAGCSIFNVNRKLAEITEQRMMDNGVGMDMISLTTPPLHVVPLFIYADEPSVAKPRTCAVDIPSFFRNYSFSGVSGAGEMSKSLENSSSVHGISRITSTHKSSEWSKFSERKIPRAFTPATLETEVIKLVDNVTYDVPHWVNITFLNFGCSCREGINCSSQVDLPASFSPSQGAQQNPRGCECQVKRNQHFDPLPSFRMFDVTSPSEKLVFPVTLRKLLCKDTDSGHCATNTFIYQDDKICNNDKESVIVDNVKLLKSGALNPDRLLFEMSELPDLSSSAPPPKLLQLSRSPDFDPILASSQLRTDTDLSPKFHTRAALEEYDDNVFALTVGNNISPTRKFCDHRLGFVPLESPEEQITSATIAGDCAGHLERFRRNARKHAEGIRDRSTSNYGQNRKDKSILMSESNSMVQTLLSPRKLELNSPSVNRVLQPSPSAHSIQQVASPGIPILSCLDPKVDENLSHSLKVMQGSLVERQKCDGKLPCALTSNLNSNHTPYGTPQTKEFQLSTSGHSAASSSLTGKDGLCNLKLLSNLRRVRVNSLSSPIGGLRRNQSELFKTSLISGNLSFKASPAASDVVMGSMTEVHPFRYRSRQGSQRLSRDRRRWSHLFPESNYIAVGDMTTQDGGPMFRGPNWLSLTSPAILPLTTDHFPSPQELRQGYTEAFYTLTIPTTATQSPTIDSIPRYRNHDDLLIEMICQRLARDFQLVSSSDSTAELMASDSSPESRQKVYHLSMGHRIHQLIYDAERQTVEVKRFVQREPHDPKVASTSYNYSLWVGLTQTFQPHQQIFHRYPQPEDNWNALDNLLCGYLDDMADSMKCRRIRFAIVPPVCTKDQNDVDFHLFASAYAAKFTKLIEYLQSRVAPSEFGDVENISVKMKLEHPKTARATSATLLSSESRMLSFKVACKASTGSVPSSMSISKFEDSRTEWVIMRLEETMTILRCFHLDVRWLACSGIAADEFVGTVRRRAKQAGLDLRRVPEYSRVSRVQIHPLVASVFLPLPVQISEFFVAAMTESLDFVMDDERIADGTGIGYGLGIDQEATINKTGIPIRGHRRSASTNARLLLERWQQRGYMQFIHRRVHVFVRLIHGGLIWIPGYDYDCKGDGAAGVAAANELFQKVCNTIESQCDGNLFQGMGNL